MVGGWNGGGVKQDEGSGGWQFDSDGSSTVMAPLS